MAHQAVGVGLSQRGGHALGRKLGLAVDIKDAARSARRERRQQHGLEQPVRIALHQVAVLEDAGLPSSAFTTMNFGVPRAARQPAHFTAVWK